MLQEKELTDGKQQDVCMMEIGRMGNATDLEHTVNRALVAAIRNNTQVAGRMTNDM